MICKQFWIVYRFHSLICSHAEHLTTISKFFTSLTQTHDFDPLFKVLLVIFRLGTERLPIRVEKKILDCKFQILGIRTTVGHYIIIFSRNSSCLYFNDRSTHLWLIEIYIQSCVLCAIELLCHWMIWRECHIIICWKSYDLFITSLDDIFYVLYPHLCRRLRIYYLCHMRFLAIFLPACVVWQMPEGNRHAIALI